MRRGNFSEAYQIELPIWQNYTSETALWATKQVNSNPKIVWFCSERCSHFWGKTTTLKMDDAVKTYTGILIRRDSEFLPVFRHHLLKAFETGIYKWIHTTRREQHAYALSNEVTWYSKTPKNFGLTEPTSLGIHNVMFPFAYLAGNILVSFVTAFVENLVKKLKEVKAKKTMVRLT